MMMMIAQHRLRVAAVAVARLRVARGVREQLHPRVIAAVRPILEGPGVAEVGPIVQIRTLMMMMMIVVVVVVVVVVVKEVEVEAAVGAETGVGGDHHPSVVRVAAKIRFLVTGKSKDDQPTPPKKIGRTKEKKIQNHHPLHHAGINIVKEIKKPRILIKKIEHTPTY
mmetsp:Transcript_13880/g.21062  ORF Transcript_13880/g.21062 Transcript_13880/m.21062 type:complete len:167 (-) Transcript_13880:211-711(-)